MAIELTTRFEPYVDEIFTIESKKSLLTNQNFKWYGANYIKVYKISTASMNNYIRNDFVESGTRYGVIEQLSAHTERFELGRDRSFIFEIDKLDSDETMRQLEASTALARQIRNVVIPEIDTYVLKIQCAEAGTIPPAVKLTKDNIYAEIIKATKMLDEAEVPETGRIIVVNPDTYMLMKQNKEIMMQTNISSDMLIKGIISNLDGCYVMKVPSKRLPNDFGFMMVHPEATTAPVKLEDYKIHENPVGYSGSIVQGRICYDAFVPENKKNAIYYQSII